MSSAGGPDRPDALLPDAGRAGIEQMPFEEPRRAASLTLRADEARTQRAVSMAAAHQSLSDALRVTFRLLQVVMVALVLLFLFSGMRTVNQGESGVRVQFGSIVGSALEPGFRYALPRPIGEIIKVSTGQQQIELRDSFMPKDYNRDMRLDQQGIGSISLRPGIDGSLITADGNLMHAEWQATFRRENAVQFLSNLFTTDVQAVSQQESDLVRAMLERAVVRTIAEMTIDDVLKRGARAAAPGSPT
ncbi:MAG: hypothetical protein IBJ11_07150, partial [Phycisphaerales bacterium]|nr:hypothetical protein [Phycisphaerales bacterium]